MKRKIVLLAIVIFVAAPAIIWAAQKTLTTYTWDEDIGIEASGGGVSDINFNDDIEDFTSEASTTDSVSIDSNTRVISMGREQQSSCSVLWYGGNKSINANTSCSNGVCDFGSGFNVYFEFRITTPDTSEDSSAVESGFTFTIMNGANNSTQRRGGPPEGRTMGQLMCYAGSGNMPDQLGLQPPKIAIEFDTRPDTGLIVYNGCNCRSVWLPYNRCDENSCSLFCSGEGQYNRADGSRNHIAVMYWGNNRAGNCNTSNSYVGAWGNYLQQRYDDNVHGAGGDGKGANRLPVNSSPGGSGYCQRLDGKVNLGGTTYNWMEDGQWHRVRIEVNRGKNRTYNVKTWVDCEQPCCSGGTGCASCPESELVNFKNLQQNYDNGLYPPKINREISISPTLHDYFDSMIFGFTQATGLNTQNIEIRGFELLFYR